jgi:hypothetical protein
MKSPNMADVNKDKNGKAWHQKKEKDHLKDVSSKYASQSRSKGCNGGSDPKGKFNQGNEMESNESLPTTADRVVTDEREKEDSAENPIVTVEKPDAAKKTIAYSKKRQHVNLTHSSSDRNGGGHIGGSRGGPRYRPRGGHRGGSWVGPRGGPRGGPQGGVRGPLSSRGLPPAQGAPNSFISKNPWDSDHYDGFQELQHHEGGFQQSSSYTDSCYGFAEYDEPHQGFLNHEEYGYGYDYGASDPFYSENCEYGYVEGPGYGYNHGHQEIPPSKRHRPLEVRYFIYFHLMNY